MKYKLGLALSGGGARGFAHIGVIMALEKFGLKPNIISGVSAGSVIAALYGAGLTPRDILKCFSAYNKFYDYTEWNLPKEGLFKMTKFGEKIEEWLPIKNIEETKIPIVICATNFDSGKSVGWTKGPILERVLASCSIPIIFNPIEINGVNYVDGGVLRNLPAWAIRNECKTLIGSNCSPLQRDYKFKPSIVDIAIRSYNLMAKSNTLQDILLCDYVIQSPAISRFKTFDVNSMKKITLYGYDCACKVIENKLIK